MTDYPLWQNDNDVVSCYICSSPFTWINRRHHCRKCGRVVCGDCSSQPVKYFPRTLVVTTDGIERSRPQELYRTCDECVDEINMIRRALEPEVTPEITNNLGSATIPGDSTDSLTKYTTTTKTVSRESSVDNASDINLCPICATNLTDLYIIEHTHGDFEEFKESHINNCLTSFDFNHDHQRYTTSHPRNKMLVYIIPPIPTPKFEIINSYDTVKQFPGLEQRFEQGFSSELEQGDLQQGDLQQDDSSVNFRFEDRKDDFIGSVNSTSTIQEKIGDNECVICLEDLKPGDKVGRLECLCVFHYKCIKDWFNKKGYGECPVHYLHK